MKIKGPANYTPPVSPDSTGEKGKPESVSNFSPDSASSSAGLRPKGEKQVQSSSLENSLRELAKTTGKQGLQGEEKIGKIVDSILEEVMGKDFLSRPDAASLRAAITPLVAHDEHLSGKLNSILARLKSTR